MDAIDGVFGHGAVSFLPELSMVPDSLEHQTRRGFSATSARVITYLPVVREIERSKLNYSTGTNVSAKTSTSLLLGRVKLATVLAGSSLKEYANVLNVRLSFAPSLTRR